MDSTSGSAYAYLGGPGGLDATADGTLLGAAASDQFGKQVSSAGDFDGDGFADVVVGAGYNDAGGADAGRLYLYLGGAGGSFDPTVDFTFTGAAAGDRFGDCRGCGGDLNADGYSDLVVGARLNDANGGNAGRAYVYFGSAAPFDGAADGVLTGGAAGDEFGGDVAHAGDVDGDGFGDVVLGAGLANGGGTDRGRAYLYRGAAGTSFEPTADATLTGAADGDTFGDSVARRSLAAAASVHVAICATRRQTRLARRAARRR